MNTEAQRARNKRKRDKLREKRRMNREDSILRFRLDGYAYQQHYFCGLVLRSQFKDLPRWEFPWCRNARKMCCKEGSEDIHEIHWSTEWVYMATHDFSSSAFDATCAFINTGREFHDVEYSKAILTMQLNGVTRRYVWQGHTPGLNAVRRMVCSFASSQFSLQ
jgi:hypothetical protein